MNWMIYFTWIPSGPPSPFFSPPRSFAAKSECHDWSNGTTPRTSCSPPSGPQICAVERFCRENSTQLIGSSTGQKWNQLFRMQAQKKKKPPSAFKQHHHIHRRSLCFDEFPAAGWLLFPGLASDKSLCPSTLAAIVIRQHIHNVCWSSCSALAKRPARARYSLNVWAEGSRGAWEVKIKKTCAWGSRAKECRLSFIPYLLRDPGLEHMHARPKSNRRMVMYNFEVAYTVKAFLRGLCCGMQIRDVKDLNCVPNIYKNTIEILWHGYENIADSLLNVRLRRHSKTYTACHPLHFNRLTVKDAIGLSFFFFISLLLSALTTDRHTLPCSLPPARLRTK